jgi:Tol biopolymer transport system component
VNTLSLKHVATLATSAVILLAGCENPNGPPIEPVAPPTILFDMENAGNRDIYRALLDGLDLERLTTDPGVDLHPTAASNTLVFTSYRDGNGELYTRPLNTAAAEIRLTTTAANETEAQLSPDGLRLAYTRDDGGTPRVWVATANNANAVALTTATGSTIEGSPTWRFASDSLLLISTSLGSASIFRSSRLAGSTPATTAKPATTDSAYVEPAWSVDGKTIAFTAGAGAGASRIAVLTRATNSTVFVTPATMSAGQPVFLADGRIVFTVFAAGGVTTLAWVDPAAPGIVHSISLTGTNPQHPTIIWP